MIRIFFNNRIDILGRELISLLKGGNISNVGESSGQRTEIAHSYHTDTKKFLDDTVVSLNNYTLANAENVSEMIAELDVFTTDLSAKLVDMKIHSEQLVEQRTRLAALLTDFKHNI